jgi:DNA (cytosine-5)-methyltransferase 1
VRPRLLDLFCGAGGAAVGYHRAGFDVVGVDIKPQPHYPFEFHQADALTFPLDGFDAIHASPPCQAYSVATARWGSERVASHPALIAQVRERLIASGLPYVIENVETARSHLRSPIRLCGTSFNLGSGRRELRRHRLFELGRFDVLLVPPCSHRLRPQTVTVVGGAGGKSRRDTRDGQPFANTADRLAAMETPWMNGTEVVEAIPPAYTEWIGRQLLAVIERAA